MIVGLYEPGHSILHRLSAGPKMILLVVFGTVLVVIKSSLLLVALAGLIGLAFLFLGTDGWRHLWRCTRPLIPWLVLIGLAQGYLGDADTAIRVVLRLMALVWAATLVTLTTRLSDMTDGLVRVSAWFKPLGVSPTRVAFMVALTLRLIPALGDVVKEVREAQRARGLDRSIMTLFVPILTRVLQQADVMSDALVARGYDRWDETS